MTEESEKYKVENKKDIQTHLRMVGLYKANPDLLKHIGRFLHTKDGIRPIALQRRYPKLLSPFVWYPHWDSYMMLNMSRIDTNFLAVNYGQLHFYECIFDEKILNEELISKEITTLGEELNIDIREKEGLKEVRSMVYNTHIIGMSVCFDIDSPKYESGEKVNCFDIWDRFMFVKYKVEWILKSMGIDYICVFSGNGIYVITEDLYVDNYDDFEYLIYKTDEVIDHINNYVNRYYKGKIHPAIDKKKKSWWNYDKVPFTYHTKWHRITIPLPKGKVDMEYVKRVGNIDIFEKNNIEYTKEIIEKVGDNKW